MISSQGVERDNENATSVDADPHNKSSVDHSVSIMVSIKTPAVTAAATIAIRRVVTCFIVTNPSNRIAIFHRCPTMPSFPSRWAGISGSIEKTQITIDGIKQYETPYFAARRELMEETNLFSEIQENVHLEEQGGLYLDVPYTPKSRSGVPQTQRIIRVYPFVVHFSDNDVGRFEMRGTEHDTFQFVEYQELTKLESMCVPGLIQAFHHATYGQFDPKISNDVRRWANDKENGASVMTKNAIQLVNEKFNNDLRAQMARHIVMLRPSMVPIVNVMHRIIADNGKESMTTESFLHELDRCVTMGQAAINDLMLENGINSAESSMLRIGTFSRSGTLAKILKPLTDNHSCSVVCSQSTPGDEGELMAEDLNARWVPDLEMYQLLNDRKLDLLLIGSDCLQPQTKTMVNKIGTKVLCEIAQRTEIPVFCCADIWKVWDDIFPPPIEEDLFEFVPLDLVTKLVVPPPPLQFSLSLRSATFNMN